MYRIGIDIGGTNIALGILDENNNIIFRDGVPTLARRTTDEIASDMAELCERSVKKAGMDFSDIEKIGLASPGVVNPAGGTVEYANNLPFRNFDAVGFLKSRLPVKNVFVENDANAAAWGEAVAGASRGVLDSVMITLGTGVGGGVIINGEIYSGSAFAGAELGHMVIEFNGRQCSCGRKGCWEAYSSATALTKMTEEKIAVCEKIGRETLMSKAGKVGARTACDAMRKGDGAAKEVYDEYVRYLACGLVNIVNILQPEIITLGGGISNEGQSLVDSLEPWVRGYRYGSAVTPETDIRIAMLGNDAGIIGAANLERHFS